MLYLYIKKIVNNLKIVQIESKQFRHTNIILEKKNRNQIYYNCRLSLVMIKAK